MRRREFITLVSSAAAWPFVAREQQAFGPKADITAAAPERFCWL
jgi:hypothetical protein